jgi:hypothetical protein
VADILNKNKPIEFDLINKRHKNPGKLVLESLTQIIVPSFVDYLRGNLQLNLITAIDFTGSNGYSQNPQSLHYLHPNLFNQYQNAMKSIWSVLEPYDYDKRIPSFAFGAIPRFPTLNQTKVNHCFPLSGDYNVIEAVGFDHFMQLYINALRNV